MKWKNWLQLIATLIVAGICFYIGKLILPVVQTMTPAIGWTLSIVIIVILASIGLGFPAAIFISLRSLHIHHFVKEIEARKLAVTERGFIQGYISRHEQIIIPQITAHSVEVPGHVHIQEERSAGFGPGSVADWRERLAYEKLAWEKEKMHLLAVPATPALPDVPGPCTFSQVLTSFQPSLEQIMLGYLPGNLPALASADGLCHVALAGATGGGKSALVRLLMAQLCFVGASVLLLNPHYTRFDVRSQEDWTPFEPYLFDNPMVCRDYEVIKSYLRQMAEELLPKRLRLYAHSQTVGKPFYIVLDELPAIVKHVPEAPGYMADILREGRKVGLFLVTAAQDFLVKTVMGKDGSGAVRDCFRTAVYVGGDPTTARVLLDVKGNVDDGQLGKGVVMLRGGQQAKQAQFARVPYCDNDALYHLLGPSTYQPVRTSAPGLDRAVWSEPVEPLDSDFEEDPARVVDADDLPYTEPLQARPTNVRDFPQSRINEPVEPSDFGPKEYRLDEQEITQFIGAYKASGSIEKALSAIGRGGWYKKHASEIVKSHNLRKDA